MNSEKKLQVVILYIKIPMITAFIESNFFVPNIDQPAEIKSLTKKYLIQKHSLHTRLSKS